MAGRRKTTRRSTVVPSSRRVQPRETGTTFQTSYSSLLYGILTVIVLFAVIFLGINFFINRHVPNQKGMISDKAVTTSSISPSLTVGAVTTGLPTAMATPTQVPSTTAAPTATGAPTAIPSPVPTVSNAQVPVQPPVRSGRTYTVQAGDDLWNIAQKVYGSGYNWVDIARANNLVNPGTIHSGNVLTIPALSQNQIAQKTPVTTPAPSALMPGAPTTAPISGATYVVQKGDYLSEIAERAYGNPDRWPEIAKANNLSNPSLIFSGNTLTIPR